MRSTYILKNCILTFPSQMILVHLSFYTNRLTPKLTSHAFLKTVLTKNYRRHRYRGNGGPGAPQARGLVRPESNSSTATASEHSICMKRDNSYLESTEEEWLKVTNLGFTWITINTENQFTLAWQKSPILTAHYSLDSIKKQFWVENSENLHLKF